MKLLQCPCCATEVEPQLVLTIWQLNDPSSTLHVMTANGSVEAPKPVYCWRVCKFDRRVHVLEVGWLPSSPANQPRGAV